MKSTIYYEELLKIQKNRYPFLFIDRITDIANEKYIKGYKNLTSNDWFFSVHWPGDSNMPGVLQLEGLVQLSSILYFVRDNVSDVLYLRGFKNVTFYSKVLPGDRLDFSSELIMEKRGLLTFKGMGSVDSQKVLEAEFVLVAPNSIVSPGGVNNDG